MAILNPHHILVDGLPLATVAHGLQTIGGVDQVPDHRIGLYEVAHRHGAHVNYDTYRSPRSQRLRAWVSPYDADGAVSHPNGVAGQRRANIEELVAALAPAEGAITVQKLVPHPTTVDAVQTLEAEAFASGIDFDGTQLRTVDFTLTHPYPFWHLLPVVGPVAVPASIDLSAATAPLADAVLTFTGDGRVTYTNPLKGPTATQYVDITGSGGAGVEIDLGARNVTKTADGSPAWNWFDTNTARWLELDHGQVCNLTTTGTVTITYYHPRMT